MTDGNVFSRDFLELLAERDEPASLYEVEWAGEWKVVSPEPARHLVLRSWEDPARDQPTAILEERPTALLCAAVLPLEARPRLYLLQPVEPRGRYGVLVRDTYNAEAESESRPIGEVRQFSENQVLALHLAGCFARAPHALALLLEAAGPTAIRLAGDILARRLAAGA